MKTLLLALCLLSNSVYALAPFVNLPPGTCVHAREFNYRIVKFVGKKNGKFVYEVKGNQGSPNGVIVTTKQFTSVGSLDQMGMYFQYIKTIPVVLDNGFTSSVDIWTDCAESK